MRNRYLYPLQLFNFVLLLSGLLILTGGCDNKPVSPFSKSAEEALSTFTLEPGFKIELIASEPLVRDPVDMTIDENGRMYVVEMLGVPFDKSGVGKVVLLSDTNHDGLMDKSIVFADSLIMPSGIMRWKKGVIITDPPNVYYMEDTDGDGREDIRKTMLTGFDTSNLEANVNCPRYGLDNWIYLASIRVGHDDGIHYSDDSTGLSPLPENSLRFRPDRHQIETLSGESQFGQTFDEWGNHLLVQNSNHIYQEVLANRYLHRNPAMIVSNATQTLAEHSEVFSITKNPEYQMLTEVGVFTSACGLTAYLGGAFPDKYNSNTTFVAEPVSNVIHVDHLTPNGVTFRANRILEHKEFLASTDPYCRLVNMYIGPDGALYVIDFYREVIEGPEFMAEDVLKKVDLYNGTLKGRIYRISATDGAPVEWTKGLHLGDATDGQLVEKLSDKNIWWRSNAQRLLVDRNSNQVVPALIKMARDNKSPLGRLHALWTLEGMDKLPIELIISALQDPVSGIRENAIRLAELHLDNNPNLTPALIAMQQDPDPKVRFQLLCSLGFINTPEVNEVRQQLLFKDINDKWVQIAALSASSSQASNLLDAIISKFNSDNYAYESLVQRLSAIIGTSQDANVIKKLLLKATSTVPGNKGKWQAPLIEGLAEGIKNRKSLPSGIATVQSLLVQTCMEHPSESVRKGSLHILRAIGLSDGNQTRAAMLKARQMATNVKLSEEQRAGAIDFLGLRPSGLNASFLKNLINPREPLEVQLAALNTLSLIPNLNESKYVLQQWSSLSPQVRSQAINNFMSDSGRISLLLDAIESGKINKGEISWSQSVELRSLENMALRKRSRIMLTETNDNLKDIIQKYQAALKLNGDPTQGKTLYLANCAFCHQISGKMGRTFGPDLGTVHGWAPRDIITNILDPNRSISHGYDMWNVTLNNGELVQGIISTETPTALTLTDVNGLIRNIGRQDIQSLKALNMSAMPVGLEKKITPQGMMDLLSFLRSN
jgi:putative membrane-bound dehydrogenase-like protein